VDVLHMVEIRLDLAALYRFLGRQRLADAHRDEDLGYGAHAWLAAAFGEAAPKPWRVWAERDRPARILGYSLHDEDALRRRVQAAGSAMAMAVIGDADRAIATRPLPAWRQGRRLGFEVLCCPVGRAARSGVEKDVFLMQLESGQPSATRQSVYAAWTRAELEKTGALTVTNLTIGGFRLVKQLRRGVNGDGVRREHILIRPQVLAQGELVVGEPSQFSELMARGVGRHRAFGYGMLLLRPTRE